MTLVTFMTLCQYDSSFTDLTSRKIKSNLAELVLLVHAGHCCDSHPGTDKLAHEQLSLLPSWTDSSDKGSVIGTPRTC